MAYNKKNYYKHVKQVVAVYELYKDSGLPDTQIVRTKFPEHGINISYRTWVNMKGIKPSEYAN